MEQVTEREEEGQASLFDEVSPADERLIESLLARGREVREGGDVRNCGCVCDWDTRLTPLIATRTNCIEGQVTGEVPLFLKEDVIYRVRPNQSRELSHPRKVLVKSLVEPLLREKDALHLLDALSFTLPESTSFAKSIRSELYRLAKVSVPDQMLSEIGILAREQEDSLREEFSFSLTREFDRDPRFYCNEGSCYWGSGGSYSRSMCSCKAAGVMLLVRVPSGAEYETLQEMYPSYRYRRSEENTPLARALVIPVRYRNGRYNLSFDSSKKRVTRLVVTNSYDGEYMHSGHYEGDRQNNCHCLDTYLAEMLTQALHLSSLGDNAAPGGYTEEEFYMNSFFNKSSLPIIHIGRDAPTRRYNLDLDTGRINFCQDSVRSCDDVDCDDCNDPDCWCHCHRSDDDSGW
jgi:hypothetical protein